MEWRFCRFVWYWIHSQKYRAILSLSVLRTLNDAVLRSHQIRGTMNRKLCIGIVSIKSIVSFDCDHHHQWRQTETRFGGSTAIDAQFACLLAVNSRLQSRETEWHKTHNKYNIESNFWWIDPKQIRKWMRIQCPKWLKKQTNLKTRLLSITILSAKQ